MSTFVPKNWKRHRATPAQRAKNARAALRLKRLALPITPERIATFVTHLIAVSFDSGSECWLYVGCGKGTTLPEDLKIKTTGYANVKFNGETVGPHQFALAASMGITLADLVGSDTHHSAEIGRCIGYRCCNPDHLEQTPSTREHRGSHGDKDSLTRFQTKTIREIMTVPANQRRPEEYLTLTGAGSRRRFLAGMPFLIRGGVIEGIEGEESGVTENVTCAA